MGNKTSWLTPAPVEALAIRRLGINATSLPEAPVPMSNIHLLAVLMFPQMKNRATVRLVVEAISCVHEPLVLADPAVTVVSLLVPVTAPAVSSFAVA
jgi:hypothetical protein